MFFNKNQRKMRNPYATIALLSLAATGIVTITNKTKKFIKEKMTDVMGMVKGMKTQ